MPQQERGDTIRLAHPEGPYIHRQRRHEPNPSVEFGEWIRRCGVSQPIPTPLTCKAEADYTWTLRIRQQEVQKLTQCRFGPFLTTASCASFSRELDTHEDVPPGVSPRDVADLMLQIIDLLSLLTYLTGASCSSGKCTIRWGH